MPALTHFLVLIPGIHDVPGTRESAFQALAVDRAEALTFAADHYGLPEAPAGTRVIRIAGPTDTRTEVPHAA